MKRYNLQFYKVSYFGHELIKTGIKRLANQVMIDYAKLRGDLITRNGKTIINPAVKKYYQFEVIYKSFKEDDGLILNEGEGMPIDIEILEKENIPLYVHYNTPNQNGKAFIVCSIKDYINVINPLQNPNQLKRFEKEYKYNPNTFDFDRGVSFAQSAIFSPNRITLLKGSKAEYIPVYDSKVAMFLMKHETPELKEVRIYEPTFNQYKEEIKTLLAVTNKEANNYQDFHNTLKSINNFVALLA
jgi:hypothetical protein